MVLKLIDLKSNREIGLIKQEDYQLTLIAHNAADRSELEQMLEEIKAKPVYLVGGGRNGTKYTTQRRILAPDDPDYLLGIKDAITRKKVTINGRRIKVLQVE